MGKKLILLLCFITLLLLSASYDRWELVKDKENIKVFAKISTGSDLKEFKAETVINARIEVIMSVLRDIPAWVQWLPKCIESRVVNKLNDYSWIIYCVSDAPWPVKDRDYVIERTELLEYESGRAVISFNSTKEEIVPCNKDIVRMKLSGEWIITYIDREHVKIEYTMKSNLGGKLSSSMINNENQNFIYKTILGLKKIVTNEKYINAGEKSKDREEIENFRNKNNLN